LIKKSKKVAYSLIFKRKFVKSGWVLAASIWLLATGIWLLASGCWHLAAGIWRRDKSRLYWLQVALMT
jgi:hypothetical protein